MTAKLTRGGERVLSILLILVATIFAIIAAHALREAITHTSVGLAMIALGCGLNGFVRLQHQQVERSWVAAGALLLAAIGVALIGMKRPYYNP